MTSFKLSKAYISMLRTGFSSYRNSRFANHTEFFEPRAAGRAVVFERKHASLNVIIPPTTSAQDMQRIIDLVTPRQRHRHFRSLQSSQALAQSVFGTISVQGRFPMLSKILAEDGCPAFGPSVAEATIELEKSVQWLGEPRPTSVDVWLNGPYRVAIECKLAEADFGTCSRPRLKVGDASYPAQHCDGTYSPQRGRKARCALAEIGVKYWDYAEALFGWATDQDHRPCPMASSYQLVRNVLAAGVTEGGVLAVDSGHALVIYDQRNPTMAEDGDGDRQWRSVLSALRVPGLLRRLSWQDFIAQWPNDEVLNWLKNELNAKYGIHSPQPAASA